MLIYTLNALESDDLLHEDVSQRYNSRSLQVTTVFACLNQVTAEPHVYGADRHILFRPN
jgi:hypothetical protein